VTHPTWTIAVTGSARRQLSEQLPEAVAAACIEFLKGPLSANPHRVGAPLRKPFEGQWRARRGTYRIRYRIDEGSRTVYVLDIEHRRDAYRS
jgi:mRNA-degrading endonuclease RelE of RelBE toxin-antitoxin system